MSDMGWFAWFMADGWVGSTSVAVLVAVTAVVLLSIIHFMPDMASLMEVI